MDEVADEVFDKSDEEVDITSSAKAAPHPQDHEVGTSTGAAGSKEE